MPTATRLTIAIDPTASARLEALAGRDDKDPVELAAAVVAEIEAAVREADAGDFATDAKVAAAFARWGATLPR